MLTYRRRAPEGTALYRLLAEHLQTFLERIESGELNWPAFVTGELTSFLDCGILARHCTQCGKDALVAFSREGRGLCPSCGGRRMAGSTQAHPGDGPRPIMHRVKALPSTRRFILVTPSEMETP